MPTKTTDPKPVAPTKSPMDDGARIGRLVRTFQRLERERDTELQDAPQSIHARFAARRRKAAEGHPPHIVNAASAAVEAMRGTAEEPPESE